ncbi:hypothetical protein PF010_g24144 [Phytophthora fragariae]|uniref:Uncharacterized protein n=1 Tax=Phytophthora fragariae TaxID=53985 RepID=A0A6G0K3G2_9STRA|nr:hypothetical protein PF010_g24144 [Phytophthora fragariae]KAE9268981.1 hypothetical protein PF008_g30983 [Phytophthora fragariae]
MSPSAAAALGVCVAGLAIEICVSPVDSPTILVVAPPSQCVETPPSQISARLQLAARRRILASIAVLPSRWVLTARSSGRRSSLLVPWSEHTCPSLPPQAPCELLRNYAC